MIVLTLGDIIAITIFAIIGIIFLVAFLQEIVGELLNKIKSSLCKKESEVK